jgi:hypothetical protein
MSYSLEQFAADCREVLKDDDGPSGREKVRQYVEKALKDEEFVAQYLDGDGHPEREVIYEDPDFGFCICAHVYEGAKQGQPHDHGPTWAIYGQARGETEMTDWKVIQQPDGDKPGKVEFVKSYKLTPGVAHAYEPGAVHAPLRDGPTRLIRVEGKNCDHLQRTPLEAA